MANTITAYNPYFYAQEALIHLEKALGMASRVHLGYDEERRSFKKGQYVNIRKPSVLTVANAPATAEDLLTEEVQINLSNWKEVKFLLSDKELGYTGERIVAEHIRPGAYALADNIDQALAALYKDVPWYVDLNANPGSAVSDITGVRKVMRDQKVPLNDVGDLHYMVDSTMEGGLLANAAFTQFQGGGAQGAEEMRRGTLGQRFGFEVFANQNTPSHTPGTAADSAGALTAATAVGDTTIAVDAMEAAGDVVAGDVLVITGDAQQYAITAPVTFSGGAGTIAVFPAIKQINADNAVVTLNLDTHVANLAFHRNAFALVTAPLSDMGKELGAKIAVVQDPITGLALRSRLYYVGNSSVVHVALDVLYGVKTLDPNLACRGRG